MPIMKPAKPRNKLTISMLGHHALVHQAQRFGSLGFDGRGHLGNRRFGPGG
jgi:hypothetical protein